MMLMSGPLATSDIAFREAWRGRSLVICHGRHQDRNTFETQWWVHAAKKLLHFIKTQLSRGCELHLFCVDVFS